MDWQLIAILSPALVGIIAYAFKVGIMNRIERLEAKTQDCQTEDDVRRVLNDKLEPMKEHLEEIRTQINKIFDRLMQS